MTTSTHTQGAAPTHRLYVVTNSGVSRTTDSGTTWTDVDAGVGRGGRSVH